MAVPVPASAPRFDGELLKKLAGNLPALIELFLKFRGNLEGTPGTTPGTPGTPEGGAVAARQHTPEQLQAAAKKALEECK